MTDQVQEFARLHGVEWDRRLSSSASKIRQCESELNSLEDANSDDDLGGFHGDGEDDALSALRTAEYMIARQPMTPRGPQLASFNRLFRDSRETDYGLPYEQMRQPVKFGEDYIKIRALPSSNIEGFEFMQPFKNNLSVVLECAGVPYLVTASSSLIVAHTFSSLTRLPDPAPELVFDVEPFFTSLQDRLAATWPNFPHTINYLATTTNFAGHPMLGACIDSGKVHLWKAETIFATKGNGTQSVKVYPDHTLDTGALVWGLVFARCGNRDIVVTSDNSRRVSVFCYLGAEASSPFTEAKSERVAHNIPSVTIISSEKDSHDKWRITIGCASIAGSTYILETTLHDDTGQITVPKLVDHVSVGEECWTVNAMDCRHFHRCESLASVFGDQVIDGEMHARRILHELRVLGQSINQHVSRSLGGATRWQFYECATLALVKGVAIDAKEWAQRVYEHFEETPSATRRIILVSGMKLISLLDAVTMHCYSKMPQVFEFPAASDESVEFSDRLSLSLVIPRLLIVLVASQRGKILVMRICTFRGIIGMRQEATLSGPEPMDSDRLPRTIVGLATRNLSIGTTIRSIVYVTYSDGIIAAHELSRDLEEDIFLKPGPFAIF